jgi:hypothetical protein
MFPALALADKPTSGTRKHAVVDDFRRFQRYWARGACGYRMSLKSSSSRDGEVASTVQRQGKAEKLNAEK